MSEFTDLAREIAHERGIDIDTAYREAWRLMPELLADVMSDARFIPKRVVMLMTAQELIDFTGERP